MSCCLPTQAFARLEAAQSTTSAIGFVADFTDSMARRGQLPVATSLTSLTPTSTTIVSGPVEASKQGLGRPAVRNHAKSQTL